MALIVIASAKGSPGASTTALAMASQWPRPCLLAELDPLGGDLVYRLVAEDGQVLDRNRGMISLALAGRRGLTPDMVREHTQRLAGGQDVLVGLATPEQATGWTGQWPALGRVLAAPGDADVIADVGRLYPDSPANDLLPYASLVLLVCRAQTEDLAHVRARAATLCSQLSSARRSGPPVGVLVVAEPRQRKEAVDQVAQVLAAGEVPAEVSGVIALDHSGAEQLAGRRRGRVHKSTLVASARQVVASLGSRFGLGRTTPAAPAPAGAAVEGVMR